MVIDLVAASGLSPWQCEALRQIGPHKRRSVYPNQAARCSPLRDRSLLIRRVQDQDSRAVAYFVGTRRFSSSNQFSTTSICCADERLESVDATAGVMTTNCLPSGVMS